MENMEIYNRTRKVPQEACKAFNNGSFEGTDINPMWRIKTLTECFGPCGIGWYYEVLSERAEVHGDMAFAIIDLNLYIKVDGEWSKPIFGTGGNKLVFKGGRTSDEGYKMALTDALSVACKALGIGADIYFQKDKTKYTAYQEEKKEEPVQEPTRCKCAKCGGIISNVLAGTKQITAETVAKLTTERYGKALCYKCAQEAAQEGKRGNS